MFTICSSKCEHQSSRTQPRTSKIPQNTFRFPYVFLPRSFRRHELYLTCKLEQPAIEVRAECHFGICVEGRIGRDLRLHVLAEPVDHIFHQRVHALQLDPDRISIIHLKDLSGVPVKIKARRLLCSIFFRKLNMADAIRTEG